MKKLLSMTLAFAMVFLAGCQQSGGTTPPTTSQEPSTGSLTDGTYTASKPGMNADVEVEVTIADGKISDVKVTNDSETPGIGGVLENSKGEIKTNGGESPVTRIPAAIVAGQTLKVDTVTGATISSYAIINAVADCIEQAGGSKADFQTEVAATPAEDVSADVVVVGGGGAGLVAAIAAGESGAKVVIIEKNGEVGGDTLVCGAIYNAPDEALQKEVTMTDSVKTTIEKALAEEPVSEEHKALQAEVQKQWDEYKASGRTDLFDSKEWYALQTWINGDKVGNLDLVKKLCYDAFEDYQYIEGMGMEFSDKINQGAGSLWQRTHTSTMQMGTGFISTYLDKIDAMDNVTIITEAAGKSLVVTDGKVTGVVCEDQHGNEFTATASKGVVLATGGFAANSKMVQEHNTSGKWNDLSKTMTTNRTSCSQGDGIVMAEAIGASLTDMDQIQLLYLGNLKDGQLTKYPPRDANGTDQLIFVNKNGERFVREDGRRDQICLGVLSQPDAMFYMLECGDGAGYVDINDPDWRSADGFTFDYLKDNGYILVADTLEEMAEQIGCDPETLKATVDTFNACVDGTATDEFERTLFTVKLENGPWVATARQACVHHTMGGLTIDTETHVLDESGKPISGLYAAGEITGGIHGANRLGGNAVVDTVVFGRAAGEQVIADNK